MFVDIEAFFLDAFVDTKTDCAIDDQKQNQTCGKGPTIDAENTKSLSTKLTKPVTIESATAHRE